jgi:hypothetical protein
MIAGGILLLLLVICSGPKSLTGQNLESEVSWSSRFGMRGQEEVSVAATRMRSKRRVSELVVNKTYEVGDLKNFHHPAIQLEDASFGEALNRLLQMYREICEETAEKILPLRWEVDGDLKAIPKLGLEWLVYFSSEGWDDRRRAFTIEFFVDLIPLVDSGAGLEKYRTQFHQRFESSTLSPIYYWYYLLEMKLLAARASLKKETAKRIALIALALEKARMKIG